MNLEEMIENYLDYSKHVKRKGTYIYELSLFKRLKCYFKTNNKVDSQDFTGKNINDMVIWFKTKTRCENKSINKHIQLLKQLYRFNDIEFPYLEDFPLLKVQHKSFDMIKKSDQRMIFNYIDSLGSGDNTPKYRLMIHLLYDTGVRQSELLNILLNNIDIDGNNIKLTFTKSGYDRFVFFSEKTKSLLNEFMEKHFIENELGLLFYNDLRNRPFSKNDTKLFYRRVRKQTGIKQLHSHMWRHTLATELVENGCMLTAIQKQLGHRSIKTTEIYLHTSLKSQKDAIMATIR